MAKQPLALLFLLDLILVNPVIHANLYQEIERENLRTVTVVTASASSTSDTLGALISDEKEFHEVLKDNFRLQLVPSTFSKRQFALSLLSGFERTHLIEPSTILDLKTWQDLEILCGPKSDVAHYLAAQVDRTSTELGRLMLYRKIIQPVSSPHNLGKQQRITKELIANEFLFNELDSRLRKLEIPENIFMSFWNDSMFKGILSHCLIRLPFERKISFLKYISSWLNKNELALEINTGMNIGANLAGMVFTAMGAISIPLIIASHITKSSSIDTFKRWNEHYNLSGLSKFSIIGSIYLILQGLRSNNVFARGSISAMSGTKNFLNVWWMFKNLGEGISIDKVMQEKLIYTATYVNSIRDMVKLARENDTLSAFMPSLTSVEAKMKALVKKSEDFVHLLRLLETGTFEEKASFFSYRGRIFSAYRLMHEVKEMLVDLALVAGELDMHMSIARLYKEYEKKHVTFCFPTYVDGNVEIPSIEIKEFWNPSLNPDTAISNSLALGLRYNSPQSIIITGPNAAGKSTIMRGIVVNIILAQSLGIAPSRSLTFTPFSKIMTYLNITDDIAAGNSHFKAGVLRARELLNMTDDLAPHEFSLTAVDELFNGTPPKEGESAAYSMISLLGKNPGNICLTATHFARVPALELETNLFANYKVLAFEDGSGKIQYPYKLERGISDQIITFKILKEEGFDDSFLAEAEDVLSH